MFALVAATSMVALANGDGKSAAKDAAKSAVTKKSCCSKDAAKSCGDKAKTTSPAPKN